MTTHTAKRRACAVLSIMLNRIMVGASPGVDDFRVNLPLADVQRLDDALMDLATELFRRSEGLPQQVTPALSETRSKAGKRGGRSRWEGA